MTAVSTSPRPIPCGPLRQLRLWCDPLPRDGYHNMAADELLLGRPEAWLRFYGWSRPAVSFGYFDTQRMAARLFPGEGIEYIRRWTGVDMPGEEIASILRKLYFRVTLAGDTLTAEATEQYVGRSTGCYQVNVTNQHGQLVATFQSSVFRKGDPLPFTLE